MDVQLRRIIDFFKNNKNRYFEAVDIAYHLKLDEVYTGKTLALLQSKKMVTSSMSSDGKVVWTAARGLNLSETFSASASTTSTNFDNLSKNAGNDQRSEVDLAKKEQTSWMQIVMIVAVILFLLGGAYLCKWYIDKKFTSAMDVAKAAVPMHEYAEFRGKCIQDNEGFQKNIDDLYSQSGNTKEQIDSLKLTVSSIQQQILELQKMVGRKR